MKLTFTGEYDEVLQGIKQLAKKLSYEIAENGDFTINVKKEKGGLRVTKNAEKIEIAYEEKIHFFRALGLAIEKCDEDRFEIVEKPHFETVGIMLDVSRGIVPKVKSIKNYILHMALMGLDMLMLYTEDIYEIKDEPYFGYMRGRYSFDELKECDDFADVFGIEIIPCIQTLGHMEQFLKWPTSKKYADTERVLLAGNEAVYDFIERAIKSASAPFRSKRIHVGMDEAKDVGLGQYLKENGFRDRFQIMNDHVARVIEICNKYSLRPMMWSDMYFELTTKTATFYESSEIDASVIENIPKGIDFVYWDYYSEKEEFYLDFIDKHKKMGSTPIFAGGIWEWTNFGTDYYKTINTTLPALNACKKSGVREVVATLWGCALPSSFESALMGFALFAECNYSDKLDMERLKKRTEFCTGVSYEEFESLNMLYKIDGQEYECAEPPNPSYALLCQDILMGLYDGEMQGLNLFLHYKECGEYYRKIMNKSELHRQIFEVPAYVSEVLSIKGDIGMRLKSAYDKNDKETLYTILSDLEILKEKTERLREIHRACYMSLNKPFGFDICDIMYGGVIMRTDTAYWRIKDYLEGNIEEIDELEADRLPFNGKSEIGEYELRWRKYEHTATPHIVKWWV